MYGLGICRQASESKLQSQILCGCSRCFFAICQSSKKKAKHAKDILQAFKKKTPGKKTLLKTFELINIKIWQTLKKILQGESH